MDDAFMKICIQVFVWTYALISIGYIPGSGIAGPFGNCLGGTARLFSKVVTPFYIYQQRMRVLVSPHPCWDPCHYLFFVVVVTILVSVKWYLHCDFDYYQFFPEWLLLWYLSNFPLLSFLLHLLMGTVTLRENSAFSLMYLFSDLSASVYLFFGS